MRKRIIITLLSLICTFGCIFPAGCASGGANENPKGEVTAPVDSEDELKKLQQQIAELQKEIKNLSNKISDLEEDSEKLTDRIKKLEEENKKLSDRISELEQENSIGRFYSLQQAYDKGLLNKADLMNIAYYHNGGRQYNEEIISENYVPIPKYPEKLESEIEKAIRQTYWEQYYKANNPYDIKIDDIVIGNSYYGIYNNCVIVKVWVNNEPITDNRCQDVVGGVTISYTEGNRISVWIKNK